MKNFGIFVCTLLVAGSVACCLTLVALAHSEDKTRVEQVLSKDVRDDRIRRAAESMADAIIASAIEDVTMSDSGSLSADVDSDVSSKERADSLRVARELIVSKLKVEYDEFTGRSWYYNSYFTHYINSSKISLYIGTKGDNVWLRLKVSRLGDDIIRFNQVRFSYDGTYFSVPIDYFRDHHFDAKNGELYEWVDVSVSDGLLSRLRSMSSSSAVKCRLEGDEYYRDRVISDKELKALSQIISAYDALTAR